MCHTACLVTDNVGSPMCCQPTAASIICMRAQQRTVLVLVAAIEKCVYSRLLRGMDTVNRVVEDVMAWHAADLMLRC